MTDIQTRAGRQVGSARAGHAQPGFWRDAWVFVLLPLGVSLGMIFGYFSGVEWLQNVVAPAWNREFGVLENLQHLLLLGCVVLAALLARDERRGMWRAGFVFVGLVSLFVLLEEIDYGLHYYEALAGVPEAERAGVRNLHNLHTSSGTEVATLIKRVSDAAMILVFVLLPFVGPRLRLGSLSALIPRRPFALLMIVALCVSNLAHYLDDSGWPHNHSLGRSMGEFRELLIYYIGFLYLVELRRRMQAPEAARRAGQLED